MAKILILVTNPSEQNRGNICTSNSEWNGCWWSKVDSRINNVSNDSIGYFKLRSNSSSDDALYRANDDGSVIELEKRQKQQGINYFVARDGTILQRFCANDTLSEPDCAVVVIKGESNSSELLKQNIQAILNLSKNHRGHEICVAVHGLEWDGNDPFCSYSSTADYWQDMMKLRYGGISDNENLQSRTNAIDKVWNRISCSTKKMGNPHSTPEEIARLITERWSKVAPNIWARHFSILKHRIAHLFLSIDVDFQGINEVRKFELEKSKVQNGKHSWDYLKDVLESHSDQKKNGEHSYFRGKLADLQYYVGKLPNKHCSKEERDLPGRNSVRDLFQNTPQEIASELKSEIEALFTLVGIDQNAEPLKANDRSCIARFMKLLDEQIPQAGKLVEEKGVDPILNFFKAQCKVEDWQVKETRLGTIASFHDWFCALIDVLEKLQGNLQPKQKSKSQEI